MSASDEVHDELKTANGNGYRYFIYLLLRHDGNPFYVGKGTYRAGSRIQRPHQHIADVKSGKLSNNFIKDRIISKILREYGDVPVAIDSVHLTEFSAFDQEKMLIAHFGRRSNGTGSLCNFTSGGDGVVGLKHSPETKRKFSEGRKRFLASDAGRAHLERHSAVLLGRKPSDDTRKKISAGLTGRVCSEETRRKIGISNSKHSPSPEVRKRVAATLTARGPVLAFNGETKLVRDWADAIGVCPITISRRLRLGWSMADALQTHSLTRRSKS